MSGKYERKNRKKAGRRKKSANKLWIVLLIAAILLAAAGIAYFLKEDGIPKDASVTAPQTGSAETAPVQTQSAFPMYLDQGIEITDIKEYTGIYVEDGSDEAVTGVLMIIVKNSGEQPIQYGEITLDCEGQEAFFSVSTLNPGARAVLLEKNRMAYDPDCTYGNAQCRNVAFFQEPLDKCEDKLEIQELDGAMNITNISGADIEENITIYYKNHSNDIYYGGITYRITLEGGLKAGELRQVMVKHFYNPGSEIVMVTCGAG